jgi:thiamine biosynthesis lipoprotein
VSVSAISASRSPILALIPVRISVWQGFEIAVIYAGMTTVKLAREAMRVRFELVLRGEDSVRLRAAGEEALEEIAAVERLLSPFDAQSDLFRINAEGFSHPVAVSGPTATFLSRAQELTEATGGAFDLTATSGGAGFSLESETVSLPTPATRLDPGGLGKGWALERGAEVLSEMGVGSALLHGGTSSVVALGPESWSVQVGSEAISLKNAALSVSSSAARAHVTDPRTGLTITEIRTCAALCTSATDAEALSTALLVLGDPAPLLSRFPEARLWTTTP